LRATAATIYGDAARLARAPNTPRVACRPDHGLRADPITV
jgi:hypothetical protein